MSTLLWLLTEAGLVLCWLVTPWAPAPWLALCWLIAPLAGWLALLLTRKRSQVQLTCPVTAEKGKPFSVTAEVRQGVPFGRGRLTVSVENTVTGETHREKLTLHQGRGAWQVQSACCGCLVLQAAELVLWDLLGVLPVKVPCTVQGRTCVMPDTFPIEADPVSAMSRQTDCEEYAPDVRGSDPTETFQIREYVPGDSLRQIHWKLSAKAGRYMVRDAAKPVDHRLTIYVERRTAPPRLADGLMEAVVSLCQAYVDQPFRLMWSGETTSVREITGEEQLPEAVTALLKSEAQAEPQPPELRPEGKLLYCCTQLPADGQLPEDAVVLLCSDEPCAGEGVCRFTPEDMQETLGKWMWN